MAKLLKLVWVGADGEPYHGAYLAPRTARDVIARRGAARFFIDREELPLARLTYAGISRAARCGVVQYPDGQTVLIGVAEDGPC